MKSAKYNFCIKCNVQNYAMRKIVQYGIVLHFTWVLHFVQFWTKCIIFIFAKDFGRSFSLVSI